MRQNQFIRPLLFFFTISSLFGCQSAPQVKAVPTVESNLTQTAAVARAKMLSHPTYQLSIDLLSDKDSFSGSEIVTFDWLASDVDSELFLDFKDGAKLISLSINGQRVDRPVYERHRILLPNASLKAGANRVEIQYQQQYSKNGRGLYRFRDREDQRVYVYSQFEAFDAHQMFPCFDQPDLKAKMQLTVIAPKDWEVISTTREVNKYRHSLGWQWEFSETPLLSTYLFSLHAGPFHKWETMAGNIPLRLFVRESLKKFVHTNDWFAPTQQGLKFYADYFAFPYPFFKYDQVIVPDFNAGAMENAAAITFSEAYLRRGPETLEDRERLASVILHEMAHMWFGDLVTMKWWNGLWLNESFATYMSALALQSATEFKQSWLSFYNDDKLAAYRDDQLVTTHPVEGVIADTESAFTNFDGITYGKGAAVLKQLSYYLSESKFREGIRGYFKNFAYKNTGIEDFIGSLVQASGKDLTAWSKSWLETAGVDSVRAAYDCKDGMVSRFSLILEGPREMADPASTQRQPSPRTHRALVSLYQKKNSSIVEFRAKSVEFGGSETTIDTFVGQACPEMVYVNSDDQDYARARLDKASLLAVRRGMHKITSPFLRTMLWGTLFQMVRDRELLPQEYLATLASNFTYETDLKVGLSALRNLPAMIHYLPNETADEKISRTREIAQIEKLLWQRVVASPGASDWQMRAFDVYVRIAESQESFDRFAAMLTKPPRPGVMVKGLVIDQDRRWGLILTLMSYGDVRADKFLESERQVDRSERGFQSAMAVEAAKPSLDVKKSWLSKTVGDSQMSFARKRTVLRNFLPPQQDPLRSRLAADFFNMLPGLVKDQQDEFLGLFTSAVMPATCTSTSALALGEFIAKHEASFPPTVNKRLKIGRQEDDRCAAIRSDATRFSSVLNPQL